MIVDLTEREYVAMRRARCMRRREVVALAPVALLSITHHLLSKLSGSELAVLMCLLSLTIASGRIARDISIREFAEGMEDDEKNKVVCGTGLSENSIRAALKSLHNDGLVSIYREVKVDARDNSARVFEINFNRLDLGLAGKLKAYTYETPQEPPAKIEVPPAKIEGGFISNYVTHVSGIGVTSNSFLAGSGETQQEDSVGYVGKKVNTVQGAPSPTVKGLIDSMQAAANAVRDTRAIVASSKNPADINKAEMQAIFDREGKAAALPYRLMVTQREYGFLRKKLKENPPANFPDMVRFSLTYWAILSRQNRKAAIAGKTGAAHKSLPEAPHFQTFSYWYPYFFRVYQNHLAGQSTVALEDAKNKGQDTRVKALERQLVESEKANAVLRSRVVKARAAPPPPQPVAAPQRRSRPVDLSVDVQFPVWR